MGSQFFKLGDESCGKSSNGLLDISYPEPCQGDNGEVTLASRYGMLYLYRILGFHHLKLLKKCIKAT